MRRVRQGLGIIAFLGALVLAGSALAAGGDKLADKGKIDNGTTPAVTADFGDDASTYANDGECDDNRFTGPGAGKRPDRADRGHDAADCSAALTAGTVTFNGESILPAIDFGDDTSSYASNGECDDPRFEGTGMASVLLASDMMHDATDCQALLGSGSITVLAPYTQEYAAGAPYDASGITFGNDTSTYANNASCDDPRFVGPGLASTVLDEDLLHDGTDCEAAFVQGTIILKAGAEANPDIDITVYTSTLDPSINFGDNTSEYKDDGQCDDPRFEGAGVDEVLNHTDQLHDAKDCSELFDAGSITLLPVFGADYVAGAPYDSAAVDFGDNTSDYKDNGECDDPRFIGPTMAEILLDDDQMRDSADCQSMFEAGTIVLKAGAEAKPVVDTTVYTSVNDPSIDFGDNTSEYKDNGECDDPRFNGAGVADVLVTNDLMHDAKDCSTLFDAGSITMLPVYAPDYLSGAPYDSAGIEFGDDSSSYANNSECDDPRFVGPGMASTVLDDDISRDATDCKGAFEAGMIMVKGDTATTTTPVTPPPTNNAALDFGDDTSSYANDGECDDPRFAGTGMAAELVGADLGHDASDCQTLADSGSIAPVAVYGADYVSGAPYDTAGIDFGDNASDYKDNGECDDPRFIGPGMAAVLQDSDTLHDSADCQEKFVAGLVALKDATAVTMPPDANPPVTPAPPDAAAIDFGDDSSTYANNNECDDLRFAGEGMDAVLLDADRGHDATDCQTLADAGKIVFQTVYSDDYVNGAPYDAAGIDFGDNTSAYKDNDECDDPRFAGPGMATVVTEDDNGHDAADCEAKFVAGLVAMKA